MRSRVVTILCCAAVLSLSTASADARTAQTLTAPASSGQTIHMHVGDKLKVHLGTSFRRPTSTDRSVIHRINHSGGYPTSEDARATFKALAVGKATIHSVTDAPCLHSTPRCEIAQQEWFVHVVVKTG
ncbi:MAG TPA: hypothetical protein VHE56_10960 [Mycobacteriales bacterium]|nr:hypothetical protein [Mycobacteriales bacterium]HVY08780.1 hypothetical protein [Mycobacteriales bacterium]